MGESAQIVEEEEYEETVKEKRELPPEEVKTEPETPAENSEEKKKGEEKQEEKKEPEKKYEWVDVKKMKKRTKRTDLKVIATGTPGLVDTVLNKSQDEETAMQVEMKDIIETDEKRNDLESYIFTMRDKISASGDYGSYISQPDREKFESDLMKAEDWLYDNDGASKAQYIEKLDELKGLGDPVVWRFKEGGMRPEWVEALLGTIRNYKAVAETPAEKYGHISPDKLGKIVAKCSELETWLSDMMAKQDQIPKTERPVLICADMEKENQELAKFADAILKEPKSAPPKETKKEEKPTEAPKEGEVPTGETAGEGPQNMDVD